MKIISIEDLHCDAGWRTFSFLKITTDEGISGWSEYNESYGNGGLTTIIRRMAETLIGQDPRPVERIDVMLTSMTRLVQGGMSQQAIGAIGNALLDVKARSLGVPVYEMFGGPVRDRLKLYWSHCGGYRLEHADTMGVKPVRSLDDLALLGAEVARCGFSALKTNIFDLNRADPKMWSPGFAAGNGWPEVNIDREIIEWAREQLAAFRSGAGLEVDLMLDLAWNGTLEGFTRMARALEQFELLWLEMDTNDATGLANVRFSAPMPIASCETMYGQARCQPFLQARAVDTMIIDIPWNGLLESLKIAHMAGGFGVNVAPHNLYGHLATMMSAHFGATIPNFRIMEVDIDDVPWKDDIVTVVPVIESGHLVVPSGPGWGTEVNEEAIHAHPPKMPEFSAHYRN